MATTVCEHRVGDALADFHPHHVVELLNARGSGHPDLNSGLEFLPDAWDREEQGGLDLADVQRHGVDGFREVDDGSGHRVGPGGDSALGYVAEREVGQDDVAGIGRWVVETTAIHDDTAGELHVGVREHGPLGGTRGARGVDQRDDVGRLGLAGQVLQGPRIRLAMGSTSIDEVLPAHQFGVVDRGDAPRIEVDDVLERGALGFHEQCLVDLLLVLSDEDAGP